MIFYQVKEGKTIVSSEKTFHEGDRLWLTPEEAAYHWESLEQIYPPCD